MRSPGLTSICIWALRGSSRFSVSGFRIFLDSAPDAPPASPPEARMRRLVRDHDFSGAQEAPLFIDGYRAPMLAGAARYPAHSRTRQRPAGTHVRASQPELFRRTRKPWGLRHQYRPCAAVPPQPPKKISITANGVPSSFSPVKCRTSPPSPGMGTRSGRAWGPEHETAYQKPERTMGRGHRPRQESADSPGCRPAQRPVWVE